MSYTCRYPAAASMLYDALAEDSFYRTLESSITSDAASARRAMIRYLDYSMIEAETYGLLSFPTERSAGAAIWCRPLEPALQEAVSARKKAFIAENMGENCLDTYSAITRFMSAHTMSVISPGSWYLSIIGIAPNQQNHGMGFEMMQDTLRKTDRDGVATFLETFVARNKRFYARLGYRECATFREPTTGADYAVLLRPSRIPGPSRND
jgi:GNAT superfamily N-acetyltransferase